MHDEVLETVYMSSALRKAELQIHLISIKLDKNSKQLIF